MKPDPCRSRVSLARALWGGGLLFLAMLPLSYVTAGATTDSGGPQPASGLRPPPILCAQVPETAWPDDGRPTASGSAGERGPSAARIVRVDFADGTPVVKNLTPDLAAACEPDVSFDGQHILFAGKKNQADSWNIWEMSADGGGQRQVTSGLGNCTRPRYLSSQHTLAPVGTNVRQPIAFISDAPGAEAEKGSGTFWRNGPVGEGDRAGSPNRHKINLTPSPDTALWTCNPDGSVPRRITYNLGGESGPSVLDDGRIVYTTRQADGRVALLAINTDGTDCEPFVQAATGLRFKSTPCETTGRLVVFIEAREDRSDGGGRLAAVSLRRNLQSHRVLAEASEGFYRSPSRLPDGRILVSYRPQGGASRYGVCVFNPVDAARSAALFDSPGWHDVDAVALLPRARPDGRSSVVKDGARTGKFYCLNVYQWQAAEGRVPAAGTIRQVRFIEATPTGDKVLGTAPVEPDGSFQVEVPAGTPLRLELLNAAGEIVRQQRAWTWAMPNESRGCIGCHEDPELVPENVLPQAVVRDPTRLVPWSQTKEAGDTHRHEEE